MRMCFNYGAVIYWSSFHIRLLSMKLSSPVLNSRNKEMVGYFLVVWLLTHLSYLTQMVFWVVGNFHDCNLGYEQLWYNCYRSCYLKLFCVQEFLYFQLWFRFLAYFSKMKVGLSNLRSVCVSACLCPPSIIFKPIGRFSRNLVWR
jgi:hypothetical protein